MFRRRATDDDGISSMSKIVGHAFVFTRWEASLLLRSFITAEFESRATDLETSTTIRTVIRDAWRFKAEGARIHTGTNPKTKILF